MRLIVFVSTLALLATPPGLLSAIEGLNNALPDGEIAYGKDLIKKAWLSNPTTRYGHGVLGDKIEAGSLTVELTNGDILQVDLPERAVFEDRHPRLADINGDGHQDIVVVKSYVDKGAALSIYSIADETIMPLAETPPIGLKNRWRNPAGIADYDGDGKLEIAEVTTPHLGGFLILWQYDDGVLVREKRVPGFTNHIIGQRELRMSVTFDVDHDGIMDLVLPDASRFGLSALSFSGPEPKVIARNQHGFSIESGLSITDGPKGGSIVSYTLGNGETVNWAFQPGEQRQP